MTASEFKSKWNSECLLDMGDAEYASYSPCDANSNLPDPEYFGWNGSGL